MNDIDGVLLFNKASGLSSNQVLQQVKHLFGANKAGHTGTLDPLATGLLPICFGNATKFSSFMLEGNKKYIAKIQLGTTTTTYDAEGTVVSSYKVSASQEDITRVLSCFIGKQQQVPPLYSAIKVNGKPLYKYARENVVVNIKPRQIEITEISLIECVGSNQIIIKVGCSKGTYIRALAHDIGQKLGCGAHLSALTRIQSSNLELDNTITLRYIQSLTLQERFDMLLPVESLIYHLPSLNLDVVQFEKIKVGHKFFVNSVNSLNKVGDLLRIYYSGKFLGIVELQSSEIAQPVRLINKL